MYTIKIPGPMARAGIILIFGILASTFAMGQPVSWSYQISSQNHTIIIPSNSNPSHNGTSLPTGSYIGAFYNAPGGGLACAGYVQWNGTNTALAAFGNDGSVPGFANGEAFKFKIALPGGCVIDTVSTAFLSGGLFSHSSTYANNGISGLNSISGQFNPLPPSISLSGPNSFCQGDSVELAASSTFMTYQWSNGDTTQRIMVSSGGLFSVSVTDSNHCPFPASNATSITVHPLPAAPLLNQADTSLCDGNSLQLVPNGSAGSFLWSNGTQANSLSVSSAGQYSVAQVDANGCKSEQSDTVNISFFPPVATPQIQASGPLSFCDGGQVVLSGPSGYNQYLWSNNATSTSLTVTTTSALSLRVVDINGCSSLPSSAVNITAFPLPPKPTINVAGSLQFCQGDSAVLSGPAGYNQYLWSNGSAQQNIASTINAAYALRVVDANGCNSPWSDSTSTLVNPLPTKPGITVSGTAAFCDGDSVQLSGPSGYVSYQWSNGNSGVQQWISQTSSLSVQVTDANGCQSPPSDPVAITAHSLPSKPMVTASSSLSFCDGDSVQLSGPSGYVSYQWSNGNSSVQQWVSQTSSLSVQVTDANGCQSPPSDPAAITAHPLPAKPVVSASASLSFCDGDSVQLSGPSGYTSYQWSNGNSSAQQWISQTSSLSVQVTDANGCQSPSSDPVAITAHSLPAKPLVSASSSLSFCDGDSVQLSGPSGYVSYQWSNGNSSLQQWVSQTSSLSVQVTDANGCQSPPSDPVAITAHPLPAKPIVSASASLSFCAGDSVQLTGPSGFQQYSWSSGEVTSSVLRYTTDTLTLSVTDANGCQSPASDPVYTQQFSLPAQPVIQVSGALSFCEGDSSILSGPSGFASYQWSNGMTSQNLVIKDSAVISIRVTDVNGCQSPISSPVTTIKWPLPAKPLITLNGPAAFCQGDSVRLDAPSGFPSYTWSDGGNSASRWISNTSSLHLSLTDANGCSSPASDPITITVHNLPNKPIINVTGPLSFCPGDSVILSGPSGLTSYQWSGGQNGMQLVIRSQDSLHLQVVDSNGCISPLSDPVLTSLFPQPPQPAILASGPLAFCAGDSVRLKVSGTFATYLWSNGNNNSSQWVYADASLTIVATDSNGCLSDPSDTVRVQAWPLPPAPTITADGPLQFCEGGSVSLSGPPAYAAYTWSHGPTDSVIQVTQSGSFGLSVRDMNGCESPLSSLVQVVVDSIPATPAVLCPAAGDDSLRADIGGSRYEWFLNGQLLSGQHGQSIPHSQTGTYQVIAYNGDCPSDTSAAEYCQVTKLENLFESAGYSLYPNPNSGRFFLEGPGSAGQGFELSVYGAAGQLVFHQKGSATGSSFEQKIELGAVPQGLYLLRFSTGGASYWKRFLVK